VESVDDLAELRAEIQQLLAAALDREQAFQDELARQDERHHAATERRDQLHIAETDRRDVLHHDEMKRRQDTFDHEVETIRLALETRDLIGQAKGVIIATAGCTADEAFVLLKRQSQAENRKLHEIAAEIVAKAERRR
jgi:hypothetical protein